MACSSDMGFVPMTSIAKDTGRHTRMCSDWIATEKVHGSSFQFYLDDGIKIHTGCRRRDVSDTFLTCNINELAEKYKAYIIKTWLIIRNEDRWKPYRELPIEYPENEDGNDVEGPGSESFSEDRAKSIESRGIICRVRIYGELYGGGGIELSDKSAIQKEIIYCDDFRFYVFGITINKKWVTIPELGDICKEAGFPYYAKQVCEPKATVDELKKHLKEIGFMRTRSSLTEKKDDHKALIEGVVMTPLTRHDFKLNAIKFLAPDFAEVQLEQFGQTETVNFCTKQRYHSVISKFDTDERNDTRLVVNTYIQDILQEMQSHVCNRLKAKWANMVLQWLGEDEYNTDATVVREILTARKKGKRIVVINRNFDEEKHIRTQRKSQREDRVEDDEAPLELGLFDL